MADASLTSDHKTLAGFSGFGDSIALITPQIGGIVICSFKHENGLHKQIANHNIIKNPGHGSSKRISELKQTSNVLCYAQIQLHQLRIVELLLMGGKQRLYKPMMIGKGRQ